MQEESVKIVGVQRTNYACEIQVIAQRYVRNNQKISIIICSSNGSVCTGKCHNTMKSVD